MALWASHYYWLHGRETKDEHNRDCKESTRILKLGGLSMKF